jgi:hypothetical protein
MPPLSDSRARECLVIAVQALRDVVNPIGKLRRETSPDAEINGIGARHWADMPGTMRDIARAALAEIAAFLPGEETFE